MSNSWNSQSLSDSFSSGRQWCRRRQRLFISVLKFIVLFSFESLFFRPICVHTYTDTHASAFSQKNEKFLATLFVLLINSLPGYYLIEIGSENCIRKVISKCGKRKDERKREKNWNSFAILTEINKHRLEIRKKQTAISVAWKMDKHVNECDVWRLWFLYFFPFHFSSERKRSVYRGRKCHKIVHLKWKMSNQRNAQKTTKWH